MRVARMNRPAGVRTSACAAPTTARSRSWCVVPDPSTVVRKLSSSTIFPRASTSRSRCSTGPWEPSRTARASTPISGKASSNRTDPTVTSTARRTGASDRVLVVPRRVRVDAAHARGIGRFARALEGAPREWTISSAPRWWRRATRARPGSAARAAPASARARLAMTLGQHGVAAVDGARPVELVARGARRRPARRPTTPEAEVRQPGLLAVQRLVEARAAPPPGPRRSTR